MKITYCKHLENRLILRKIPRDLPLKVFQEADERFINGETGNYIAVKKGEYFGKERDMMVAYDEKVGGIEIITIHPLKKEQKENRIKSGRRRKI